MRSLRYPVLAAAVATGVLLLAGCQDGSDEPTVITEATYRQEQAIEGFDDSESTSTDTEQLADLAAILTENDLSGDADLGEQCDGGRSTYVDYTTDAGTTHHIYVAGCGRGEAGQAIDELVADWR